MVQGLLKFCLEATRGEDAVERPDDVLSSMDEERKAWLQVQILVLRATQKLFFWIFKIFIIIVILINLLIKEALNGMSVDVIEQLTNGMKILLSDTADLDQKVPLLSDRGGGRK